MIAFSTDALNTVFRTEVYDALEGVSSSQPDSENLWKEVEVYQYMTEAVDQLLKDTESNFIIFQRPVVANQQFIPLPRHVFKIRYVHLITQDIFLKPFNIGEKVPVPFWDYGDLHVGASSIFTQQGNPQVYILDYKPRNLMLGPYPAAEYPGDTAEIQAAATLAIPLSAGMPMPVMDTQDQRLVLLWMKFLAYQKQDADCLDLTRSDGFKKLYDAQMEDRKMLIERQRREPGQIVCDW